MMKKMSAFFLGACFTAYSLCPSQQVSSLDKALYADVIAGLKSRICSQRLPNGMNVVCMPADNTNEVLVGAFVLVGSAHEQPEEYGLAHILEHMVFKGTKTRKEGDLELLTSRFGMQIGQEYGAFTTHDSTLYFFSSDEKNWQVFADVVADSTQNLVVRAGSLDSELHAIAQELKRGKFDVNSFSFADFLPANHPCAHPLIGYKEQVLTYTADQVMAFYAKHYVPNKTTFFVLGKVEPKKVFAYAQKAFVDFTRVGEPIVEQSLPFYAGFTATNKTVYHTEQYRVYSYVWQGIAQSHPEYAALSWAFNILNRRLKQKYVDTLGYCFGTGAGAIGLGKAGLLGVHVVPRPEYYHLNFDDLIKAEVTDLQNNGITEEEYSRVFQERLLGLLSIAERPAGLASQLMHCAASSQDIMGEYFMREERMRELTPAAIQAAVQKHTPLFLMHTVATLPLPAHSYDAWNELQAKVSQHESVLLQARTRLDAFVAPSLSDMVALPVRISLSLPELPQIKTFTLPNGLTVYVVTEKSVPRRVCSLVFKDAEKIELSMTAAGKQLVTRIMGDMFLRGSAKYTATEIDVLLTQKGCSVAFGPGFFSVSSLTHAFNDSFAFGFSLLAQTDFVQECLDRKKQEAKESIALSQNSPVYQIHQLLNATLYKNYSWIFSEEQTLQNIDSVTLKDCADYAKLLLDPTRTALIFSGDITQEQAREYAKKCSSYMRPVKQAINMIEPIAPISASPIDSTINLPTTESIVVAVCPSCLKNSSDTPALELVNGYLNKKLFEVRERTGLFYAGAAGIIQGGRYSTGLIKYEVSTTVANSDAVRMEIAQLIDAVGVDGIDENIFLALKEERAQSIGKYLNTASTLQTLVSGLVMNSLALDYLQEFENKVMNVSYAEFCSVIKKYFAIQQWSFITTRPNESC